MQQSVKNIVLSLVAAQAAGYAAAPAAPRVSPAVFAYATAETPRELPAGSGDATKPAEKSRALALLYSAVLPGMGELYAGAYDRGRYFTASEALLWIGYAGMTIFGNTAMNDAKTYAAIHSGADMSGKSDQFLTDVGNFPATADYNTKKAADGNFSLIYTSPDEYWNWDSDANRSAFRSMHLRANTLLDNTKYFLAAIVVNHVASIIDAILAVNKYNNALKVGIVPMQLYGDVSACVSLQYCF